MGKLEELEKRKEALEARLKQIESAKSALKARESAKARKAENKVKYILGGYYLAQILTNEPLKKEIFDKLKKSTLRPQDLTALAALFPADFKAPEKKEAAKPKKTAAAPSSAEKSKP